MCYKNFNLWLSHTKAQRALRDVVKDFSPQIKHKIDSRQMGARLKRDLGLKDKQINLIIKNLERRCNIKIPETERLCVVTIQDLETLVFVELTKYM